MVQAMEVFMITSQDTTKPRENYNLKLDTSLIHFGEKGFEEEFEGARAHLRAQGHISSPRPYPVSLR